MTIDQTYEQYFGLKENPFSITPDPRFVYFSDMHREALEHLVQGAMGGANGFVLLTGDVGTGKTTICRAFLERLPPNTEVVLIVNPVLTLNEFLQTICNELDLVIESGRKSNKNLIDHLNRFLRQVYAVGHRTILIVDEAQDLSHELLEQIRLLTNLETRTDKLLQIYLVGQPELRQILAGPELLQVAQRITSRYHLGPLNKAQTREYIRKRLSVAGAENVEFTFSAINRVFEYSKGIPRLINILCGKALLSAYLASTHKINGPIVCAAEQRWLGSNQTAKKGFFKTAALGIGAVSLLVAGLGGSAYWWNVSELRTWIDARLADLRLVIADVQYTARAPDRTEVATETPPSGEQASKEPLTIERTSEALATPNEAIGETSAVPEDAPNELADISAPTEPAPIAATPNSGQKRGRDDGVQSVEESGSSTVARPVTEPPPLPSSTLETPLAQSNQSLVGPVDRSLADYTRRYAERKLLAMWGVTGKRAADSDLCAEAVLHGLNCLSESSGLSGLLRYDRPAILYLNIAELPAYAVLLKASDDRVLLDVLDREHVIPASSLTDVWDGKFLLLWRSPNEVKGHIALGAQGPAALWLRRAIDRIEGINTSGAVFDEQLLTRVKRFQRELGLARDGIVGPRTLILLQNKLAETNK